LALWPFLSPRPALARGVMQLYSVEQAKSQPLEAHAAAFSTVKFSGRDLPSNVISFAQKTLKDGQVVSKLHVIELGTAPGERPQAAGRAAPLWVGRHKAAGGSFGGMDCSVRGACCGQQERCVGSARRSSGGARAAAR
jgi:hypothetical protein